MKLFTTMMCLLAITLSLHAEKYVVRVADLDFEKKETKELQNTLEQQKYFLSWRSNQYSNLSVRTPVVVHGFVAPDMKAIADDNTSSMSAKVGEMYFAVEVTDNKPFRAYLDIPDGNYRSSRTTAFAFNFDPAKYKTAKQAEFEAIKKVNYYLLASSNYLGRPWFSDQSNGLKVKNNNRSFNNFRNAQFSLYTGGRAISDNLALDRELSLMNDDVDAKIELSSLKGITVKEIDWENLLPKDEVAIDALAMLVPSDQHVLICPSLSDMNKIVDLLEKEGSPLAQSFTVRNPFRTLPGRYKKMLGIDFPPASAAFLPVKSVAITGYDPFFPTGTDVALLLESDSAGDLHKLFTRMIKTPETIVELVGETVVITNSAKQLNRIKQVHEKKIESLGSLDEYKYFRHRYPISEKKTGFVFLSDSCIRRWGGPKMRIAASRRTKAIAALNELTARQISFSANGGALLVDNEKLSASYEFLLGKVTNVKGLIKSEKMGDLQWMTPTIEMEFNKVTKAEADAYALWRRGYEEGWAKVFDPIGFSFDIDGDTKELDLTVMPLTVNSSYAEYISVVGNSLLSNEARLSADGSVITASIAVDKDGPMFQQLNKAMTSWVPSLKIKPLSWLGDSVTLFAEKDPIWGQLADGDNELEILDKLPAGVRIEHTSKLKLAMLLTGLKSTIQSAAPDAVQWETKTYNQVKYITLSSKDDFLDKLKIHYVVTKSALIITLREDVLMRAIDRESVELKPALNSVQKSADHLYLNADTRVLMAMTSGGELSINESRRIQSYRAIPILNEWHKMWSKSDAVAVHFDRFGEDLYCPGGKGYKWNEKEMTMESVVYGFPAKPKKAEDGDSVLDGFGQIESALKFENDGLRVKLKFSKKVKEKAPNKSTIVNPGKELLGELNYPTKPGLRWEYDVQIETNDGKIFKKLDWVENTSFSNKELTQKSNHHFLMADKLTEVLLVKVLIIDDDVKYKTVESRVIDPVNEEEKKPHFQVFTKPFTLYPQKLLKGYHQLQFIESGDGVITKNTLKVLAKEDLTIGDKVYKDCIILSTDNSTKFEHNTSTSEGKMWLKSGVGIIKMEFEDALTKTTWRLKSFK